MFSDVELRYVMKPAVVLLRPRKRAFKPPFLVKQKLSNARIAITILPSGFFCQAVVVNQDDYETSILQSISAAQSLSTASPQVPGEPPSGPKQDLLHHPVQGKGRHRRQNRVR